MIFVGVTVVIVEKFKVQQDNKISKIIDQCFPILSYNKIQRLFREKNIKIDGVRIGKDCIVKKGSIIELFVNETDVNVINCYEDDNIIVVQKPRNIEVVSDGICLQSLVSKILRIKCYAVHRLDRNTEGLVIFAKNVESKTELDSAFKNRTIDKFYLALVYGLFEKKKSELVAYLKKDSNKSLVQIKDKKQVGYDRIQTNYEVIDEIGDLSLVDIKLITGKTHQIRAHMAYVNHFVIGDEKYGDSKINKMYKKRYQCLCAYKIIFHFEGGKLFYLNNKVIELEKENIKNEFYK